MPTRKDKLHATMQAKHAVRLIIASAYPNGYDYTEQAVMSIRRAMQLAIKAGRYQAEVR